MGQSLQPQVWQYNIGLAVEAAVAGFDEVQFDYVRLSDTTDVVYDVPWTEANRVAAIDGFLAEARQALLPHNVFLAADAFGYICWNTNDTRIGQRLDGLLHAVDYLFRRRRLDAVESAEPVLRRRSSSMRARASLL